MSVAVAQNTKFGAFLLQIYMINNDSSVAIMNVKVSSEKGKAVFLLWNAETIAREQGANETGKYRLIG